MFIGLEKPVAFPDNPCQMCIPSKLQFASHTHPPLLSLLLSNHLANLCEGFLWLSLVPDWVWDCKKRCQQVITITEELFEAYLETSPVSNSAIDTISIFLLWPSKLGVEEFATYTGKHTVDVPKQSVHSQCREGGRFISFTGCQCYSADPQWPSAPPPPCCVLWWRKTVTSLSQLTVNFVVLLIENDKWCQL